MKTYLITFVFLFVFVDAFAQKVYHEQVYVHTDKEYYLAGENVWIKFLAVNQDINPSLLSAVGYVELVNAQRPHIQFKVALDKGHGVGKISIPLDLPSGNYELIGYTQYMRNDGSDAFFRKLLPIINVNQSFSEGIVKVIDKQSIQNRIIPTSTSIDVQGNKSSYSLRSKVDLSIDRLPKDLIDLVVSVVKDDKIVQLPDSNFKQFAFKRIGNGEIPNLPSLKWLPEYEGHIITGRIVAVDNKELPADSSILSADVGVVGKDIRYIQGQLSSVHDPVSFYTGNIYGRHEIVSSVSSLDGRRLRLDILSPFSEFEPKQLPTLLMAPDQEILKIRSISEQLSHLVVLDSVTNEISLSYYNLQPHLSYDLDKYTRFNTIDETIREFVRRIDVSRVGGKRRMRIFIEEERRLAPESLILLDGVPVNDHEDLLNYNARNIKQIDLYNGRYLFGGRIFDCIASFVSYRGTMPSLQLKADEQLFVYNFPAYKDVFPIVFYETELNRRSRFPDFRHTLYWETFQEGIPTEGAHLSFYTSDLAGKFKVMVTGIRANGEKVFGTTTFQVNK